MLASKDTIDDQNNVYITYDITVLHNYTLKHNGPKGSET